MAARSPAVSTGCMLPSDARTRAPMRRPMRGRLGRDLGGDLFSEKVRIWVWTVQGRDPIGLEAQIVIDRLWCDDYLIVAHETQKIRRRLSFRSHSRPRPRKLDLRGAALGARQARQSTGGHPMLSHPSRYNLLSLSASSSCDRLRVLSTENEMARRPSWVAALQF